MGNLRENSLSDLPRMVEVVQCGAVRNPVSSFHDKVRKKSKILLDYMIHVYILPSTELIHKFDM